MIYCINIISDQISGQPDQISDQINQIRFRIRSDQIKPDQISDQIRFFPNPIRSDLFGALEFIIKIIVGKVFIYQHLLNIVYCKVQFEPNNSMQGSFCAQS